ncbi:hypothetical protein [Aliarcobacter butzleri]|uniref:hypothetical protein n=1 Tax=Aliarcobacter butzleri TaxID=28197 RepID=UPI0021B3624E|nr:hypothetical protein [Aliarcobacter butzleri]MCT7563307.1 hypothetical protein [Aliarcobacter butzleri]MCT7578752.1 hypothetical protein [Aliarcobacter butzleri]MCT7648921.1 hypothetical protein [Aliarcobacter butzleri]
MENKELKFSNLDNLTLEKIIAQSEKGKVNSRTFYKAFNLIEDENGDIKQFDTSEDIKKFLSEKGIPESEQYKYIFTCINGEGTKLYLVNGWHFCDRLFYVISTISWSCGDKTKDSDIYIEVNY